MFQRYLENQHDQAIMLPSSFVATPTSTWYQAAGIHLLNTSVSSYELVAKAADVFADVQSPHMGEEDGAASTESGQTQESLQSGLSAELVSAVSYDPNPTVDKVKEWMNENSSDCSESMPEWASSDDECPEGDENERRKQWTSMRAIQMSPSNLRPMTANYEACMPDKKTTYDSEEESTADKRASAELEEAALKTMMSEQQLARTIDLMCKMSGERPVDVQAMYIYKLQMCSNDVPHDWIKCSFAHGGELARRRDPSTHSANPCSEYERNQTCARGEKCRFSHGVWERGLHPQRYRTSMCSKGEKCDRRICFFAHTPAQLRKATNGKASNNESIVSFTPAAGSETKLSRRKARAIQRANGALNTSTIDAILLLPPPHRGGTSCHKPPLPTIDQTGLPETLKRTETPQKVDRIRVDVDSKLTKHSTRLLNSVAKSADCVSPASSGTGCLETASLSSSSQASTVHAIPWAEDNFGEHGALDAVHSPLLVGRGDASSSAPSFSRSVADGVEGKAHTPKSGYAIRAAHRKAQERTSDVGEEREDGLRDVIEKGVDVDHLGDPESKCCENAKERARCIYIRTYIYIYIQMDTDLWVNRQISAVPLNSPPLCV